MSHIRQLLHRPECHGVMYPAELISPGRAWRELRQIDAAAFIERARNYTEQRCGVDWLDEVQINTRLQCATSIHILTPAGHGSDQNCTPPRARANAAARFESINPWHFQIHEDDLRAE